MLQKTAMESLVELLKVNDVYKECMPYIIDIINEVYLPTEKQQLKDAYNEGVKSLHKSIESDQYFDFEDYYKRTYNV